MKYTPSYYLKESKKEFLGFVTETLSDDILKSAENSEACSFSVDICDCIDKKYHNSMQNVWTLMALNVLFKRSIMKHSLNEKHKMLERSLSIGKESR